MATNEGTCGYDKNASTGKKLTTPGGLTEKKITIDDTTEFKVDLAHLLDKHVVREAIEAVLERKGKTSRNRKKKKKAKKRDRCLRIADRKFKKPSAYKSGAVVRCRKGNIWKGVKEEQIREALESLLEKKKKKKKETLRTWFKRKGSPGKTGGWVDCNAPIYKDGKKVGYKPCGRKKGEKRAYPACKPTPGKCKDKGKGKTWGKKAAKSKK
jgi:Arc/MetJ-type ribon-helix-helix transcriptional regulator